MNTESQILNPTVFRRNHAWRQAWAWLFSLGLLAIFATLSLTYQLQKPPAMSDLPLSSEALNYIVLHLRLPRLVLAILAGASLALVGNAMQSLFHNPLASPDLLGNASSATLFTIILMYFYHASMPWLLAGGIWGSGVSFVLIYLLSLRYSQQTLILAGVALNALIAALMAIILANVDNPWALSELFFWLNGSLRFASWQQVMACAPIIILASVLLLRQKRFFAALSLGDETASTLGINLRRSRLLSLLAVALLIGTSTPFTGVIGFVGLVAPHLARLWCRKPPDQLFALSAVLGALIVVVADFGVVFLSALHNVYLGTLTALIGAPFLIVILLQNREP